MWHSRTKDEICKYYVSTCVCYKKILLVHDENISHSFVSEFVNIYPRTVGLRSSITDKMNILLPPFCFSLPRTSRLDPGNGVEVVKCSTPTLSSSVFFWSTFARVYDSHQETPISLGLSVSDRKK